MNKTKSSATSQLPSLQLSQLSVRRVMAATIAVAAVGLGFWLLFRFQHVFLILILAIVISTGIEPVVAWFHRHGLPRAVGVSVVYLVLLALVLLFIWLGVPLLAEQIATITSTLAEGYATLHQELLTAPNFLLRRFAIELPPELPTAVPPAATGEAENEAAAMITPLLDLTGQAVRAIFAVVVTFLLAFYWTLEGARIKQAFFLLVPLPRRDAARELVTAIEQKVRSYTVGQTILCLIVGLMAFVAYGAIGLPHALALAIFAGLMEAIPLIGPTLGEIPAVVVAFSISPLSAVWVIVATFVIQQLENTFLVPRVMDRAVGVRPLITLLSLFALGSLFGVAGAIVAIPLAAVVQLLLDRSLLSLDGRNQENATGRDQISLLRYETESLIRDIRHQIRTKEEEATPASDQIEDSIEAIAIDLDSILAQYSLGGEEVS